jgi:hypothetical protein
LILFCYLGFSFLFYLSPFLLAFSRLPIRINVWNIEVLFCFVLLFDFFSRIWYRRQLKMLPSWEASKTGSMSFKIRTNEPNGLLLYNNGAPHAQVCVVCRFWMWVRWWARLNSSHQRFIVPILFLIVLLYNTGWLLRRGIGQRSRLPPPGFGIRQR